MTKSESSFLFAFCVAVFSVCMLRRPDCNAGCRTVFEHILNHELKELL
jgi:hypothetical protein